MGHSQGTTMQCSNSSHRHTSSESQLHTVASLGAEDDGKLQHWDPHRVAHTGQRQAAGVRMGVATLDHESTIKQGVVNTPELPIYTETGILERTNIEGINIVKSDEKVIRLVDFISPDSILPRYHTILETESLNYCVHLNHVNAGVPNHL